MAAWVTHMVVLLVGLGVGILWSPLHWPQKASNRGLSKQQKEDRDLVSEMIKAGGEETDRFVKQFADMKYLTNEYPLQACASPDGRFVIRLLNSDGEIASEIASDLEYPDSGGAVTELNRHYFFSSDGRTYSLDIGRRVEDSTPTNVLFTFSNDKGHTCVYLDKDADGRWDSFKNSDNNSVRIYEREGLCWKERAEDFPHDGSSQKEGGR